MINKIVELRRDLTILNQSFVELCNYLIVELNCYYKTGLCRHQYSLEHKSIVFVLSGIDMYTE